MPVVFLLDLHREPRTPLDPSVGNPMKLRKAIEQCLAGADTFIEIEPGRRLGALRRRRSGNVFHPNTG